MSGDTAPYAAAREVEDLGPALIDAAGGEAALYGISLDGALVLEAAAAGLPVRRVAVYETPYALAEEDARGHRRAVPAADGAGRGDDPRRPSVTDAGGMEAIAPTLAYNDAVMGGGVPPRERLASVGVPVLAAAGEASPPWLREATRAVADAVADGTYRVLERQTHMVDPAVLAPVLAEFLGS